MWTDLLAWLQSAAGARVLQTAIVPALAILVAGVIAALIGRAALRSVLKAGDRQRAATAIGGLVEAARASAEAEETRGGRRRVARLRTEADVRLRLLPTKGADLAAGWADARISALAREEDPGAGIADLRDRLVAWAKRPSRAKRLFGEPPREPASTRDRGDGEPDRQPPAQQSPAQQSPAQPGSDHDSPASTSTSEPTAAAAPAPPAMQAAPAAVAAPARETAPVAEDGAAPEGGVPAWQRTRSGGRLQQEHASGRRDEDAAAEDAASAEPGAAPAQPAQPAAPAHREATAPEAPGPRRTPPPDEPAPAADELRTPTSPTRPAPAWLDTYDDDAEVTQNLDLKTPPPVAASAVRDRGPRGEDLVPRS